MRTTKTTIVAIILTLLIISCRNKISKVEDFNSDELKWYKPYGNTDTIVFTSEKNEKDTVIFYKVVLSNDSTSSFEQGDSKTNYLTVPYEFTIGSYHQFAIMGDGKTRYSDDILNMAKSSTGYNSLEIGFIGTFFSDEELKNIQKLNDSTYFFNSDKATDSEINVEKGIKDFTFNTEVGITNYTDDRGVKWTRN